MNNLPERKVLRCTSWMCGALFLLAAIFAWSRQDTRLQAVSTVAASQLDILDDGKQLKLLVQHPVIGQICELWCYEGGPFRYGRGSKKQDGSVVFVHTSGKMLATTTFTPSGERIWMDIVVDGPADELKQISYMGPCMQFWHSEAFKRETSLVEFAKRCFLYTIRGPVGMMDTARGPMKGFKPDAPENNPPYTQWYVPSRRAHPGDLWAFGASGDRPLYGVVGVASRDNRWLAAIGCARTRTLGQGWHDCIHHVPDMQMYLNKQGSQLRHRSVLYLMPNDKRRLLESFRQDFPDAEDSSPIRVSSGEGAALKVQSQNVPDLSVSMDLIVNAEGVKGQGSVWQASSWGGFARLGNSWQMRAYPNGDMLEFWVSLAQGSGPVSIRAALKGGGWKPSSGTSSVPALIRKSPDGSAIAALIWERSEPNDPATGIAVPGQDQGVASVRGRLYLFKGNIESLRERWIKSKEEWEHSVPYRMPIDNLGKLARTNGVRIAPNAENQMNYGLTIIPPWKDGGTLHANFPEHFEHGEVGHGILRYSDKRDNPWKIASDGRSANYEVESPELPGVMVRASAVAQDDRVRLTLRIANGGSRRLERIKPLLCFWYSKLTGFPAKLSENFKYTYVIQGGKLLSLDSIPTTNPKATAKVAYARGCSQHDCDHFAQGRGGLIDRDIDRALIAVTDQRGNRKILISFTPGKSILSNAVIPCAHADPYFGTLEPGASAEATGVILFTEKSLPAALQELAKSLSDKKGT